MIKITVMQMIDFEALGDTSHKSISGGIATHSFDKPKCEYILDFRPWYRIGEGKEIQLEAARNAAVWPNANLEDFTEEKLLVRLPHLIVEFKTTMENLGFTF